MHSLLRILMAALLCGTASASVTVTIQNAATHGSTVTVYPGQSFTAEIVVQATGEGNGISGIQVDLAATGGSSGGLTLTGGGTTAYLGPNWDTSATALSHKTGSIQPGPQGPHGTGWAQFPSSVLANGIPSTVSNIQINAVMSGTYTVNVSGLAFPDMVTSTNDIAVTPGTALTVTVTTPSTAVTGRWLFYNGSAFGGSIATPCKSPLICGSATFNNVSGYSKGLNGIYVDIASPIAAPVLSDFVFKYGNTNTPATINIAAPAPTLTVFPNTPVAGTYRCRFAWPNYPSLPTGSFTGMIPNRNWLLVVTKTTTGLPLMGPTYPSWLTTQGITNAGDYFFYGICAYDTGEGDLTPPIYTFQVTTSDWNNMYVHRIFPPYHAGICDPYDVNKDGLITTSDWNNAYTWRSSTPANSLRQLVVVCSPP